MGPPLKEDPNLIRLKEAGMTLDRRVFHPNEAWPLKEANSYLTKHLSLVKAQREELEIDLKQDEFLKLFEKQASLKATFGLFFCLLSTNQGNMAIKKQNLVTNFCI